MSKTLVIAEAGANHNRDFNTAKVLVDVAKRAGADVCKFQTYSSNTLYARQERDISGIKDIHSMFEKIELPREWQRDLKSYCDDSGIEFMSTPFDERAVDELVSLGVKRLKISGFEGTDPRFVDMVASTGLDIIMSAGIGWGEDNWDIFADIFEKYGNTVTLLHCVNGYPTPMDEVSLPLINKRKSLRGVSNVGLSDHTQSTLTPALAVVREATVIEKHFTVNNNLQGPDHWWSLNPIKLTEMIRFIREAEKTMEIAESKAEGQHINGRRSVVSTISLNEGDIITKESITTKRPYYEDSIPAMDYYSIIGKRVKRPIKLDTVIKRDDIE